MAFSILALCVVALFTGETTAGGNPGFQARITQRALDYGTHDISSFSMMHNYTQLCHT